MKKLVTTPWLRVTGLLVLLTGMAVVQGCGGGGGGGGPVVDAVATGYYDTGFATVKLDNDVDDLSISDLQAMVHNNRLILMSVSQGLIYDGTITISGNGFSGTLSVFKDGQKDAQNPTTVSVSGSINQGSSLSGTFGGAGEANGDFMVNYALSNNQAADVLRIQSTSNVHWSARIGGATTETFFGILSDGDINSDYAGTDGNFATCEIAGPVGSSTSVPDFAPISGTSLYSVTFRLANCTQNTSADSVTVGFYLGLATSRSVTTTDDTLVLVGTSANGAFSVGGDFK
jgi:hypothetical protein